MGRGARGNEITGREFDGRIKAGWGAGTGVVCVDEYQGRLSAVLGLLWDSFLGKASLRTSLAAKSVTRSSKLTVDLVGCEVAGVRIQTGTGNVFLWVLHGNGSYLQERR